MLTNSLLHHPVKVLSGDVKCMLMEETVVVLPAEKLHRLALCVGPIVRIAHLYWGEVEGSPLQ